jgi:hypothetical protein
MYCSQSNHQEAWSNKTQHTALSRRSKRRYGCTTNSCSTTPSISPVPINAGHQTDNLWTWMSIHYTAFSVGDSAPVTLTTMIEWGDRRRPDFAQRSGRTVVYVRGYFSSKVVAGLHPLLA